MAGSVASSLDYAEAEMSVSRPDLKFKDKRVFLLNLLLPLDPMYGFTFFSLTQKKPRVDNHFLNCGHIRITITI